MTLSDERAARNEALFREVNEEVARLEQRLEGREPQFVCECAAESCVERVTLPLATYERIRSNPRQFVLKPGHEQKDEAHTDVHDAQAFVVHGHHPFM